MNSQSPGTQSDGRVSAEDKAGIEEVIQRFEDVWNSHRIAELGTLLTEDAEWINVVGMRWRGKADVVKAHEALHAGMFREVSTHSTSREIREIVPGVVIVTVTATMSDFETPDGRQMSGIVDRLTLVMVKNDGGWRITSGHNTTIDPQAKPHNPTKSG
ncbi:MAG: SgcJ/EcaC family oxidoreductase [Candidatus Acidiferrales bacterium]